MRYLYKGNDFADRPGDTPIFEALDGLAREEGSADADIPAEVRLSADEAESSTVRPERPPMPLEHLGPYYRGIYFTTVALKKRFAGMEPGGDEATAEVDRYQAMTKGYMEAIKETSKQKSTR